MPTPRTPLDPEWRQPFRSAAARSAGIGEGRLRGPDLARPFHGVRVASDTPTTPELAYAPLLRPGDRFSHTSAARLWGVPLPSWVTDVVHVTAAPGRTRPRGAGVSGHDGAGTPPVDRAGLPASDPMTMLLELSPLLRLEDLVAVGDYLLLEPRFPRPLDTRPHLDAVTLRTWLDSVAARGVRRARSAAELMRPGVESPRETRLRLLLVGAGLPEPVCGYELSDRVGHWIGWFDLAWPDWRVIAEYDGDQHRTSDLQYERDISRFDRAAEAGWTVIRVRKAGLAHQRDETIRRVASALRRAGCSAVFPNRRKSIVQTPGTVDL